MLSVLILIIGTSMMTPRCLSRRLTSASMVTRRQPSTRSCFRCLQYSDKTVRVLLLTVFTLRKSTSSRSGHFLNISSKTPSELTS